MTYFLVDDDFRVVSFGPEEFPNSVGISSLDLPDGWEELFNERRLGLADGVFFYIPREDDEDFVPTE